MNNPYRYYNSDVHAQKKFGYVGDKKGTFYII